MLVFCCFFFFPKQRMLLLLLLFFVRLSVSFVFCCGTESYSTKVMPAGEETKWWRHTDSQVSLGCLYHPHCEGQVIPQLTLHPHQPTCCLYRLVCPSMNGFLKLLHQWVRQGWWVHRFCFYIFFPSKSVKTFQEERERQRGICCSECSTMLIRSTISSHLVYFGGNQM